MKRPLAAATASTLLVFASALAAPAGAERGLFAAALAPALLALVAPFGMGEGRSWREDLVLTGATGAGTALALAPFLASTPGVPASIGAGALLAAWVVLLAGLFRLGARVGGGTAHLAASGTGLFLCATHLVADPVVNAIAGHVGVRKAIIAFTINANPSLLVAAAFWERDLLKTTYGYARSDIGASYHGYTYAGWGWVAAAYVAAGATGWVLGRREAAAPVGPRPYVEVPESPPAGGPGPA